jgi:polyhydroxyalkanoate synthesis regulator phasin
MKITGRKVAGIAVTALLGVGLLGSAAFAAFAPVATDTFSLVPSLPGTAAAETPKADKLKTALDALVAKGVITQAQEDAILAAVKDAAGDKDRDALLRQIFGKLFDQSATYLGMTPADLKTKLPGTSLAAIANATAGKSRDGLVTYLTNAVNDAIAKALADGKITQAQADKAKGEAPAHIAKFVDHTWPQPKPRAAKTPNVQAFIGDFMNATRNYLGITQQDLMAQLRAGKSLGDIATATNGKSRDGLIAALTTAANDKIDQAVKAQKLTADQATALSAKVKDAVTQLVDRKGNARGVKSR